MIASLAKFDNSFVWDDIEALEKNDFYHHIENLPVVFGHNTMYGSDGGAFAAISDLDTYRPITLTTFFLDASISGFSPFAFHLTNLLAHLGVVALIFVFVRRSMPARDPKWAVVPALWFGLHPLLAEAHIFINGRSDIFCALFGLSAILVWCRAKEASKDTSNASRAVLWVGSGLLFLMSLLSKEVLVMTLPVLVLWETRWLHEPFRSWKSKQLKAALIHTTPFSLATVVYLAMRHAALSGLKTHGGDAHIWQALLRAPWLLLESLAKAFLPLHNSLRFLHEDYERLPSWVFWTAWVVLLVVAGLAIKWRQKAPILLAAWLWFNLTLAPASLITGLQWYGWGRYLYLPLAGLCVGLTVAVAGRVAESAVPPRTQRILTAAGIMITVLMAWNLHLTTNDWQDSEAFYRAIINDRPDSSHGYGGLGKYYTTEERYEEATALLLKATELNPGDDRHLNNLGVTLLRNGRCDKAIPLALYGAERFPDLAKFPYLAALCLLKSDPEFAAGQLLEALLRSPNHASTLKQIAKLTHTDPGKEAWSSIFQDLLAQPAYESLRPLMRESLRPQPQRE